MNIKGKLMRNQLRKYAESFFIYYTVFSIIVTFIGRVTPIKQMIGANIEGTLYNLLALGGGVLWLMYWLIREDLVPLRYLVTLYVFMTIMVVSSVVNMKYGIVDNIKTLIWTVIQLGVIFVYPKLLGKEKVSKLFDRIWEAIAFFWFFPVVYAFSQFLREIEYWTEADTGRWIRQGFIENRLFGIFNDPNYAAMTSFCVVIALIYIWGKRTNKIERMLICVNLLVQVLYIRLSGSRTVLVCMVVSFSIGSMIFLKNRCIEKNKKMKLAYFIVIPVAITIMVISVNYVSGKVCLKVAEVYQDSIKDITSSETTGNGENSISIDRTDTELDNISNNRTTIWKSYLSLLKGDVLLGGSPRNFMQKWIEKEPTCYLAEKGMETHNGYLSVLVGTGILGFSSVLVFIIFYLKDLLQYVLKKEIVPTNVLMIEMLLCAFVTFTFFFTDLFFVHSLTSVLFWFLCGMSVLWLSEESTK